MDISEKTEMIKKIYLLNMSIKYQLPQCVVAHDHVIERKQYHVGTIRPLGNIYKRSRVSFGFSVLDRSDIILYLLCCDSPVLRCQAI